MRLEEPKLFSERVTLRTCLISLLFVIVGIGLLYFYTREGIWAKHKNMQIIVQQLGSLLVVTAVLTLAWELVGKRAFLDEVLAKAQLSRDIKFSGILQITDSFHTDINWDHYITQASKIDIFFAYGRTWRNAHSDEFQKAVQKKDARIRVVLPDPNDSQTVAELAKRFGYTEENLVNCIKEAEEYFKELHSRAMKTKAEVHIWFLSAAPAFTFYRFDHTGVLALYTHRKERTGVPTFVCEQGGTLYDYIRKEFDAMINPQKNLSRNIF